MTREHLVEDIRNVLEMSRPPVDPARAERLRSAFRGLHRHVVADLDAPERVENCLAESLRVLDRPGAEASEDAWDYARTCLEAALDFAVETRPLEAPPTPSA